MPKLLFSTPHGSHLYGTAHSASDEDFFEVYENRIGRIKARFAKQKISGKDDVLRTDLSTFMQYAKKGVPQYLEAMYSDMATVDLIGTPFRYSFRPDLWEAIHTYRRTITALYNRGLEENDDKFKRHAWRLAFNLRYIERGMKVSPLLSPDELLWINDFIHLDPLECYDQN